MRKKFIKGMLVAGILLAAREVGARETQLAGVRLGRPQQMVIDLMGNPTRIYAGVLPGPGGAAGVGGMAVAGMPGAVGAAMPGGPEAMGAPMPGEQWGAQPGMVGSVTGMPGIGQPGMMPGEPGAMGAEPGMLPPGAMPGEPGMPGMEVLGGMAGFAGMPGAGGVRQPTMRYRQRYLGLIAGMMPEQLIGWIMSQPGQSQMLGGEMSAALGPGAVAAGPAGPEVGGAVPGMQPDMGIGAPGAVPGVTTAVGTLPGAGQPTAQTAKLWIYQREKEGVTYVFSFSEEGRVSLICVGDDKPYSTTKGGKTQPFTGARTSKGITLGSSFKDVILAYGYPESTEVIGNSVMLKYLDRHGVAFTFRQNFMRVDSITIKSPEE